jgi:hypothetical protein
VRKFNPSTCKPSPSCAGIHGARNRLSTLSRAKAAGAAVSVSLPCAGTTWCNGSGCFAELKLHEYQEQEEGEMEVTI